MRQAACDRHSSRSAIARALKQPTRKAWAGPAAFPIWSCSRRGMPSMPRHRGIWWALAPPFHPYRAKHGGLLSVALSEGRPSWVLPSVLPCGARTFLSGPMARSDGLSGSRLFAAGDFYGRFTGRRQSVPIRLKLIRQGYRLGSRNSLFRQAEMLAPENQALAVGAAQNLLAAL